MPDMEIGRGARGTPQINFEVLPGESFDDLRNTAVQVTAASQYAKSSLQSNIPSQREKYKNKAVDHLARFISRENAESFISAVIDGKFGRKIHLELKGPTDAGGFVVTNVEEPKTP